MDFIDALSKSWAIILAAIGFTVWLIRLEGRTNYAERTIVEHRVIAERSIADARNHSDKLITELQAKHAQLDSKIVRELTEIKVTLATLVERLKHLSNKED